MSEKDERCNQQGFSTFISSPSRTLFLPHPIRLWGFFNPAKLMRLHPIFILKTKTASTMHYKLQNPSFFLCPCRTGTFRAAVFAALLSTLEHWEARSALFSN